MLNAPLTAPSASPIAEVAAPTPRFTALGVPFGDDWPVRPVSDPLFGKASGDVLPSSGDIRPPMPHCTPIARAKSLVVWTMRASISTCGCGLSSVAIRFDARLERRVEVGDDERVGPRVELDRCRAVESALLRRSGFTSSAFA